MKKWKRKPQERDGNYNFSGIMYITQGVKTLLSFVEIAEIYQDVRQFAKLKKGIDYLQVYVDESGNKLFFIDQLAQHLIDSDEYPDEENYCTLMLASEY
jgi:hypothetical protein